MTEERAQHGGVLALDHTEGESPWPTRPFLLTPSPPMLREVGKRIDRAFLLDFLHENAVRMPRTALSYATEHLDPAVRAGYRAMTK